MTDAPQTEDPMVAALLREREGYLRRGMADRVKQVDEQLTLRGYTPPKDESKTSRSQAPKGRRQRPTETA